MINNEHAVKRIAQMQEAIGSVKDILKMPKKSVCKDNIKYGALERFLQVAIENALHVGNFVIASRGLRKPEKYEDIMSILIDNKVVPKKFAKDTSVMAPVRNSLVYDLETYEREETFDIAKKNLARTLHELSKVLEKSI